MNIIISNSTFDYPYDFSAGNTKMEMVALGLKNCGDDVALFNSFAGKRHDCGVSEKGVEYYSFKRHKFDKFYICNAISYYRILKKKKRSDGKNHILTSSFSIRFLIIQKMISFLLGYKLIYIYHEDHYASNEKLKEKVSGYLYDNFFACLFDSYLPISHVLLNKCARFHKPTFILPILSEYDDFSNVSTANKKRQLVYCASIVYYRVITVILAAFTTLHNVHSDVVLKLVLYGGGKNMYKRLDDDICRLGLKGNVEVLHHVETADLKRLYRESLLLLIPLDPSKKQDKARFSQKIAEYLSSATPLLTVKAGEIPYYFTDGVNAFVADDMSAESMFERMNYVLENIKESEDVGKRGFALGKDKFDCRTVGKDLHGFLSRV